MIEALVLVGVVGPIKRVGGCPEEGEATAKQRRAKTKKQKQKAKAEAEKNAKKMPVKKRTKK